MAETKRLGGRRVLAITPELLVEFCKRRDNMHRTFTVEKALPDDARIVEGRIAWAGGWVEVVLESAEWQDSSSTEIERLESPIITQHYIGPGMLCDVCNEVAENGGYFTVGDAGLLVHFCSPECVAAYVQGRRP